MGWEQSDNVEKAHRKTFPRGEKSWWRKGSTQ